MHGNEENSRFHHSFDYNVTTAGEGISGHWQASVESRNALSPYTKYIDGREWTSMESR